MDAKKKSSHQLRKDTEGGLRLWREKKDVEIWNFNNENIQENNNISLTTIIARSLSLSLSLFQNIYQYI